MYRTKAFIKKIGVFILLCLGFYSVVYSGNLKSIEKQLTENNQKQWIFEKFEMFMGNNRCLEGENYTFFSDNTVEIKKCIDGVVKVSKMNWVILSFDDLDIIIDINAENYILIFFKHNQTSRDCLILRKRAQTKIVKTQDKILCGMDSKK